MIGWISRLMSIDIIILIMNMLVNRFVMKQWVSRAKTLLKRRKKAIKSRPISAKKLQQQSKQFNYAKEYKALQIQKELDKRTYASQHINQLMDQIFYPDVQLANEEAAKIYLDLATKQHHLREEPVDELDGTIKSTVLAVQLIQLYETRGSEFQVNHFVSLFDQMKNYFRKRDRVKQKMERDWAKMNTKNKKMNPQYKEKKFPYLFIDKDDAYHYQPWNRFLDSIYTQFEKEFLNPEYIQKQGEQQTKQDIDENLIAFSTIIQFIGFGVNQVPVKFYEKLVAEISKLNKQKIQEMAMEDCKNLLQSLAFKDRIKYDAHSIVEKPQINKIAQTNEILNQLVARMLQDPNSSTGSFILVSKALKNGIIPFTAQLQQQIRPSILSNLSSLPFQSSVDILILYLKHLPNTDAQFVQLIKFDVLRKSTNAINKRSLLKCMRLIQKKHLCFGKSTPYKPVYGYDLLEACATVLCSKYCGSNQLTYEEVIQVLDIFFNNSIDNFNLLELIASQVVKIRDKTSLRELTSCVFKIFLLGYRSPVLSRVLYQEQKKRYQETRQRIRSEEIRLIEGEVQKKDNQTWQPKSDTSPEQVSLEQDLIISLWLLFFSSQNPKKPPISPDSIMLIYPIKPTSTHPLIYQLCQNLNWTTKKQEILWQIQCKRPTQKKQNNIEHRLDKYYLKGPSNAVLDAMRAEAQESGEFIKNYHVPSNRFLRETWSGVLSFSGDEYLRGIIRDQMGGNWFSRQEAVSGRVLELRSKAVEKGFQDLEAKNKNKQKLIEEKEKEEQYYKID